jgi:hypothetical protein
MWSAEIALAAACAAKVALVPAVAALAPQQLGW